MKHRHRTLAAALLGALLLSSCATDAASNDTTTVEAPSAATGAGVATSDDPSTAPTVSASTSPAVEPTPASSGPASPTTDTAPTSEERISIALPRHRLSPNEVVAYPDRGATDIGLFDFPDLTPMGLEDRCFFVSETNVGSLIANSYEGMVRRVVRSYWAAAGSQASTIIDDVVSGSRLEVLLDEPSGSNRSVVLRRGDGWIQVSVTAGLFDHDMAIVDEQAIQPVADCGETLPAEVAWNAELAESTGIGSAAAWAFTESLEYDWTATGSGSRNPTRDEVFREVTWPIPDAGREAYIQAVVALRRQLPGATEMPERERWTFLTDDGVEAAAFWTPTSRRLSVVVTTVTGPDWTPPPLDDVPAPITDGPDDELLDVQTTACDDSTDGRDGIDGNGTVFLCIAGIGWDPGEW